MSVTSIGRSVMIMDIKYTLTEAIQCQRKVCAVYSTVESRKVLNDLEDLLEALEIATEPNDVDKEIESIKQAGFDEVMPEPDLSFLDLKK